MFEMAIVLMSSLFLMAMAYEFTFTRREWGENTKSFF